MVLKMSFRACNWDKKKFNTDIKTVPNKSDKQDGDIIVERKENLFSVCSNCNASKECG